MACLCERDPLTVEEYHKREFRIQEIGKGTVAMVKTDPVHPGHILIVTNMDSTNVPFKLDDPVNVGYCTHTWRLEWDTTVESSVYLFKKLNDVFAQGKVALEEYKA